jgi:hypothetical protein
MTDPISSEDQPRFFAVIHGPNYPRVMMEDEDRIALWDTAEDAREAIQGHAAVRAFGAEIFELGTAKDEA